MNDKYILNDKIPMLVGDLLEWARWMNAADRHVNIDLIGNTRISTVFLGLDHGFGGNVPVLFETMIFGGPHDGYQERCSTWEEAEIQHNKAKSLVIVSLN
jgi:hypothetical protein